MSSNELSRALITWFEESSRTPNRKRRRWSDDPVGRTIRSELMDCGNWKHAPRGNPKAGFRKGFGKSSGAP